MQERDSITAYQMSHHYRDRLARIPLPPPPPPPTHGRPPRPPAGYSGSQGGGPLGQALNLVGNVAGQGAKNQLQSLADCECGDDCFLLGPGIADVGVCSVRAAGTKLFSKYRK